MTLAKTIAMVLLLLQFASFNIVGLSVVADEQTGDTVPAETNAVEESSPPPESGMTQENSQEQSNSDQTPSDSQGPPPEGESSQTNDSSIQEEPPPAVIATGDAESAANVENTVNTNTTTVGNEGESNAESLEATSTGAVEELSEPCCPQNEISVESENDGTASSTGEIVAETGSNSADQNSGNAVVATGDASSAANVVNVVNTNIVDSGGFFAVLNVFTSFFQDLDLRTFGFQEPGDCPGPCSIFSSFTDLAVFSSSTARITNDLVVRSGTGENSASQNGLDSLIDTGDANAAANVVNVVNTNIIISNYLLLVFNDFGDWVGDLVFPAKSFFEKFTSICGGCVAALGSNLDNAEITNENDADIFNSVFVEAETGSNKASSAGASVIATGNAASQANIINQANTNIFNSDSFLVLVRVFGDWQGNVFSAPDNITWNYSGQSLILYDTGPLGNASTTATTTPSSGTQNVGVLNGLCCPLGKATIQNQSTAVIANNVKVFALTGKNLAAGNGGSSTILTGDAKAVANLVNVANTNIVGRNWVLALINIFGNWQGNVAFGRPDLWVGESVNLPLEVDSSDILTFTLTVMNRGDADATRVRLEDGFNGFYLTFDGLGSDNPAAASPDSVAWDLGTIKAGDIRTVSYQLRVKDNLPFGRSALANSASVTSFEEDANPSDNVETTNIEVQRRREEIYSGSYFADPDLKLFKINNASSTILAGTNVDYTITLKNQGMGSAYDVRVEDVLTHQSSTTPLASRSWSLGEVFAREDISITYTVELSDEAPPGEYKNVVDVVASDYRGYDMWFLRQESLITVGQGTTTATTTATTTPLVLGETSTASDEATASEPVAIPSSGIVAKLPRLSLEQSSAAPEAQAQDFESLRPESLALNQSQRQADRYAAAVVGMMRHAWPWLPILLLLVVGVVFASRFGKFLGL